MIQFTSLAWLYWNPDRDLFEVPIINHTLRWYGLCFVIGFAIGYFIAIPMFLRKLRNEKILRSRDIASWTNLLETLKIAYKDSTHLLHKTALNVSPKLFNYSEELTCAQKDKILTAFSNEMQNGDITRSQLDTVGNKCFNTTYDLGFSIADKLTWFLLAGTLIGARLGHVFLYDWPRYQNNLIDIFKIWEGGLASHGGTIGVILAIVLFSKLIARKFPDFTYITFLDIICVPTAETAFFIRIGNFMNQEILGTETTVPWAVVFGTPLDGSAIVPRHPVQLYEAFFYLFTFVILYSIWRVKDGKTRPGLLVGLFLMLVFGSRFVFEFFKASIGGILEGSVFQTGQVLSIPFIILGLVLFLYGDKLQQGFSGQKKLSTT